MVYVQYISAISKLHNVFVLLIEITFIDFGHVNFITTSRINTYVSVCPISQWVPFALSMVMWSGAAQGTQQPGRTPKGDIILRAVL